MKQKINYSSLLILIILSSPLKYSFAQEINDVLKYYPLEVGNYWEYESKDWIAPGEFKFEYYNVQIVKDTILSNGLKYSKIIHKTIPDTSNEYVFFERVDSNTSQVYRYSDIIEDEYILDSLEAKTGDVFFASRFCWYFECKSKCNAVYEDSLFGINFSSKQFELYGTLDSPRYSLAQGLGITRIYYAFYPIVTLLYAKIHDVEFGTPLPVNEQINHQVNGFNLYQNYPNPFNPITKIKYQIPETEKIILKIFDVLGNEIATLADEEKAAGEYEAEFMGNTLPSGIYFYQLKAGNFIEMKKMILLK